MDRQPVLRRVGVGARLTGVRANSACSGGEQGSIGRQNKMKTVNNQQESTLVDECCTNKPILADECRNTSNKLQECPVSGMPAAMSAMNDTESPGVVNRR